MKILNALVEQVRVRAGKLATDPRLRRAPSLPARFRRKFLSPRTPWDMDVRVPALLKGYPGIVRDPAGEAEAFAAGPLPDFMLANAGPLVWLRGFMWRSTLPAAPRRQRATALAQRVSDRPPSPATTVPADQLTTGLKELAAQIGLSGIGVAHYDEKYIFESFLGTEVGDRMIVCALEQAWAPTQKIPSSESEQTALSTYAEAMTLASAIGDYLVDHGYRVKVHDAAGPGMAIHFAVEAGLGQLGLNGQLLTPVGSRCRLILVNTNAPLVLDEPKDFGIPALCDACQVCVRRCPPGAIPVKRKFKRGVEKSSLNTKRCLPIVAQAHGCAICMKVCPVQRYGLQEVLNEFEATGEILGRGTDELEAYHWPIDGRTYGVGQKPRMSPELTSPSDMGDINLGRHDPERLSEREIEQARDWA
ncbi:4Fe-4S dicluster domain-containing protein [Nocardioides humi]|uniref:4Fe-4S ferredoxin-type domain-containing protein n=1 Tax=Nocardioides humi TaxID=449461 RepID=A0ABN2AGN4_9ACTN|nr:4Fe-4S dicluster domain-containing protein [Nocardioides humi]